MAITHVTRFHAASGEEGVLADLIRESRTRMRSSEGCEVFDVYADAADPRGFVFLQRWSSSAAHDTAFVERILQTGHLDKVLAVLDEPIVQHTYDELD